jgi:hypothetical protein
MPASEKEVFDLLYDMLEGYYRGLIEAALKVAGPFLIVAGWLLTSQAMLSQVRSNAGIRYSFMGLILVAHSLYLIVALRAYLLSRSTYRPLEELNYMDPKYGAVKI